MQVTELVGLLVLLEVVVCGVSALPITTAPYESTLAPCMDCEGSRRAGTWMGGSGQEKIHTEEDRLHEKQADKLDTLLGHINKTLQICEDRNFNRDAVPEPRFVDYDLPPRHSLCPNVSVPLLSYTQEVTSTLASYTTLLQLLADTEADYQTEVIDTDPAFSELATLTQAAACELGINVRVGSLCDRRGVPTESTTLGYQERFWWDVRIVSDIKMYVDSAGECMRLWPTRQL